MPYQKEFTTASSLVFREREKRRKHIIIGLSTDITYKVDMDKHAGNIQGWLGCVWIELLLIYKGCSPYTKVKKHF